MTLTVAEIAARLGGILEGGGVARIAGAAGIYEARTGEISYVTSARYAQAVAGTAASALLVPLDWSGAAPCDLIKVANPEQAITVLSMEFSPPSIRFAPGVHPTAAVDASAELGEGVSVGAHVVLEAGARIGPRTVLCAGCYIGHGASLGADCKLYPHVSVRERVSIGSRTVIHNGAVIGSDGFGYAPKGERWEKIPQLGTVVIGDDVEIGANVTVDRARFGRTVIGNGVKIDNLVQVAHNVVIGENTVIAAQVGFAGSARIGRHVQIGGQAGVMGHLSVGDHAVLAGRAGVTKDVPPAAFVSGFPAMAHDKARKMQAHIMRLPEWKAKVDEMEKRLKKLEIESAMGEGRSA